MKKIIRRFAPQTILAVLLVLFAVAAVTVWAAENSNSDTKNEIDLQFSNKIQLTAYVDGAWSGGLSKDYGFGDTATIAAPVSSGSKVFSHWEADGSVISYSNTLKLTMNADTTLYAVYVGSAPDVKPVSGFTSITRTNAGNQISFQAFASPGNGTLESAGIVYSTSVSGETLKIDGAGVTNVAVVKAGNLDSTLPESVLDENNCWMLRITPADSSTVYHARTYVTVGGETVYGDVKNVRLSDLESGISLVADPDGKHPDGENDSKDIADLLADVKMYTVTFDANGGKGTMAPQAVLGGTATALNTNTFIRDNYTFSGWSTTKAGSVAYTDGQSVTFSTDTILYAQWKNSSSGRSSGSGSSGSGGTSGSSGSGAASGSTASGETYTVPVSGEKTVNVSTNISNGDAIVDEITQADIDSLTASGEATGETKADSITIDLSGAKSEVTSVQLSDTSLERLAKAVTENTGLSSVVIKMTKATVELDAVALSAVSSQAEGKSIKLVVADTETTKLNAAQKESLKKFVSVQPFQVYIESNGKEIHDFQGGKATLSVKFTPETGRDIKHYHMYYLPENGVMERYATRYINGMLSCITTHFSDYAIVYDETMENETGKEDGTGSSEPEDNSGSQTDSPSNSTANGKTAYQNALSINKGLKVSQTGSKINMSWGKVYGADRYEVYAAYCGKKYSKKPTKTITKKGVISASIKKLDGKKLSLGKNFKVYIVAYKTADGKKQKLGRTIEAHVIGRKNTTYTNVKAITLKKSKATIKKGKTWKVKASVVLVDPSKKMLSDKHAPTFRYASSNKKIAAVNKSGKVTAKKKGTCVIYVYAKNGYAKKVRITVK